MNDGFDTVTYNNVLNVINSGGTDSHETVPPKLT